jgi:DNA-binding CsgD family transcriptional regulator
MEAMPASLLRLGVSPQNADAIAAALLKDTCCRVLILARSSEILGLNDFAAEFLGSSSEQLIGTRLVDHYPSEIRDCVLTWLNRPFVTSDETVVGEYVLRGRRWKSIARRLPVIDGEDRLICVSQPLTELVPLENLAAMISLYADRTTPLGQLSMLTDREFEVAALIAASLTDGEIARELHRSVRTVHAHRRSIGQKLGLKRRSEVAEVFRSRGLGAKPSGISDAASDLDDNVAAA